MITEPDQLFDYAEISERIMESGHIWQLPFVQSEEFGRFVAKKGLNISSFGDEIRELWQLGVLRADLVVSTIPIEAEGLSLLNETQDGEYFYSDDGLSISKSPRIVGGTPNRIAGNLEHLSLQFHPFRYFVVDKCTRQMESVLGSMAMSLVRNYQNATKPDTRLLRTWWEDSDLHLQSKLWNEIAELAIAVEPFTFSRVFGVYNIRFPPGKTAADFEHDVRRYADWCRAILNRIGLGRMKETFPELKRAAFDLEPNTDIHWMLRLTKGRYRLEKVSGRVGGAMYLLAMAESIRRAAESEFDVELPEEDEVGIPGDASGLKNRVYGSERLLDDHAAKQEFLRSIGLDYGVRVRWYVEGNTEYAAIKTVLGHKPEIEVVNLRGLIVAKHGKGLSFKENLLNDINRSVFSVVSLDGDVVENRRVLLRAVKEDEICGMFFISNPDFELANFELAEIVEVIWDEALELGVDPGRKGEVCDGLMQADSGKSLIKMAKRMMPVIVGIDKGAAWGEKLIQIAKPSHKRYFPNSENKVRPIIGAISQVLHLLQVNYQRTRKECRVDIETGLLVLRSPT